MDELLLFKGILWGSVALLILLGGSFLMFVKYERDKINFIKEKARRELEFQREIRTAEIEIVEELNGQIARELHDNIGQTLSLIRLAYEQTRIEETTNAPAFIEMEVLLDRAITEIRNVSRTMNSDFLLANNFASSIQLELQRMKVFYNVQISFNNGAQSPNAYSNDQLLMAYRIFQEALANALKHSGASSIEVSYCADNLLLQIQDNGKGFNTASPNLNSQINGLRNMQRRAQLANLKLKIESSLGNGTRVCLEAN
jgi:two-component system NarL family sensor kinase